MLSAKCLIALALAAAPPAALAVREVGSLEDLDAVAEEHEIKEHAGNLAQWKMNDRQKNQYVLKWLNRGGGEYAKRARWVVPVKCQNQGLYLEVTEVAQSDPEQNSIFEHCTLVTCGYNGKIQKTQHFKRCPDGASSHSWSKSSYVADASDMQQLKASEGSENLYDVVGHYRRGSDTLVSGRELTSGPGGTGIYVNSIRTFYDKDLEGMRLRDPAYPDRCYTMDHNIQEYNKWGLTWPEDDASSTKCLEEGRKLDEECATTYETYATKSSIYWKCKSARFVHWEEILNRLPQKGYWACHDWLQSSEFKGCPHEGEELSEADAKPLDRYLFDARTLVNKRAACESHLNDFAEKQPKKCREDGASTFCTDPTVVECSRKKHELLSQ